LQKLGGVKKVGGILPASVAYENLPPRRRRGQEQQHCGRVEEHSDDHELTEDILCGGTDQRRQIAHGAKVGLGHLAPLSDIQGDSGARCLGLIDSKSRSALHGDAGRIADLDPDTARAGSIRANLLRHDALGAKPSGVREDDTAVLCDVFIEQDTSLGVAQ
jgi:hypothetical protein